MNKTNFSSKLASIRMATFGVLIAAAVLEVDSVQAFVTTIGNIRDGDCDVIGVCAEGDKSIFNFEIDDVFDDATIVELLQNQIDPLDYEVVFDFIDTPGGAFLGGPAEITYDIGVLDPDFHIVATRVDSDVFGILDGGTTTVEKSSDDFDTIISQNGGVDDTDISPSQQVLTVTDTFSTTGPGEINEASNEFLQVSTKVPEPTTILGLLTVGALGLGIKWKKQS